MQVPDMTPMTSPSGLEAICIVVILALPLVAVFAVSAWEKADDERIKARGKARMDALHREHFSDQMVWVMPVYDRDGATISGGLMRESEAIAAGLKYTGGADMFAHKEDAK